jgi:Tfp pilus assembly protein PilN
MFRSYVSEVRKLALCYDDVTASRAISLQLAGSARRERRVRRDRLSIETSGFFDSPRTAALAPEATIPLESAFDPQADISARRRGHVIEHGWR